MLVGGKVPDNTKVTKLSAVSNTPGGESGKQGGSKYIPPSMRDGAAKRTDVSKMAKRGPSYYAIRIDNLSNSTTESDLEELVKQFGPFKKRYLAKDKSTGECKGYAYIQFKFRNDAAGAIAMLNGYGYDNLILRAEWSERSANSGQ